MKTSEIELQPTKYEFTPDKNPNSMTDETITTASTTPASSPESDTADIIMTENPLHQHRALNLSEAFNEAADSQTNSISDRIRPTFEIHLSPEEEITHCIIHDINWSFITPIGLQQYDYELKKITVVLSVDELQNLGIGEFIEEARNLRFDEEAHLSYDELVNAKKKTNINDRLSIEQWRNLEIALIKSPYGRTVIGYSINEEVYLKFWGHVFQLYYAPLKNLGYPARDYQYPPRMDDTEKLMLDFFQNSFVIDINLSTQITAYSYLFIQKILEIIYNEDDAMFANRPDYYNFIKYFSIVSACVFFLMLGILRSSLLDKKFTQKTANKAFYTLQEFVNNINRLYSYLLLVQIFSLKTTFEIVRKLSIPIFIFSAINGINKTDKMSSSFYKNIKKHTNIKFLYYSLDWTSYNQTLLSLGSSYLINLPFYYDNDDDKVFKEYYKIYNVFFYFFFSVCLINHLNSHPQNNEQLKYFSKYSNNIQNGLAYSLFDGLAFLEIYSIISAAIFLKTTTSSANKLDNSLYFTFMFFSYLFPLHARYVNTQNISQFSMRDEPKNSKFSFFSKICYCFNLQKNSNNLNQESDSQRSSFQ